MADSFIFKDFCEGKVRRVNSNKEKVYDIIYSGDSKTWLNRLSEVLPREEAKELLKSIRWTIKHFEPVFGYSDGVDLSNIELQQDIDNEIEIFFEEKTMDMTQ